MACSTCRMRRGSQGGLWTHVNMTTKWQVNVGKDCWTDLDEVTTRALEVSWRNGAQVPVTVDEWPNYVYFVGAQLKETNVTTTKQRSLRRLMILDQDHEQEASLPGC